MDFNCCLITLHVHYFVYWYRSMTVGFINLVLFLFSRIGTIAKWVYLTICTQMGYTCLPIPCRAYMHVSPRIRHAPSYTLGCMYVPPGIHMYSVVYGRVHMCTQSYTTELYVYSAVYDQVHKEVRFCVGK